MVIRESNDVYQKPSVSKLEELKKWFIDNVGKLRGPETGVVLHFGSGRSLTMFSPDQSVPTKDSDEPGQIWIGDCSAFN